MPRVKVLDQDIDLAFVKIVKMLEYRLKTKGELSYASTHEAYGIIEEERNELLDALTANDRKQFIRETIDIAVACIFAIASEHAGGLDW